MQKIMIKKPTILLVICAFALIVSCTKDSGAGANASASQTGQNGSLTRFLIVNNYLYTISNDALFVYNITNPASPVLKNNVSVGFAIQTIFAYQDKLFIGSNTDMYIYSLANPEVPSKLATVTYFVRGKDPVVARDSVAYSTVRNEFGGGGVLNCFNIKNINQPITVNRLQMINPYGLGLKDAALYVCEADSGIKVFNIANTYAPVLSKTLRFNEVAYDVIVAGNILVCYIKGGVSFFDITNAIAPVFISSVKN